MPISSLFNKYRASYAQPNEEPHQEADGRERARYVPLNGVQLRQASRNEFRVYDSGVATVKRRGNGFYHRCVCWLEDHVFSHLSKMPGTRTRRRTTNNFSRDVKDALFEIGIEDYNTHPVVEQIEARVRRGLPLRSSLVRDVLEEVAHLGQMQAVELWEEEAPEGATAAFKLDADPPGYDELVPRVAEPPDEEAPPDYEEWQMPDTPPTYDENQARRNNEDERNPV